MSDAFPQPRWSYDDKQPQQSLVSVPPRSVDATPRRAHPSAEGFLTRLDDAPARRARPQEGLRSAVYELTGGRINLGLSPEEQKRATLQEQIATDPGSGLWIVMVWAQKGGVGKFLDRSTTVPTPFGWTTMGEVKVGDTLLGRNGETTKVLKTFDHEDLTVFDVYLSDGQVFRACEDHNWQVAGYYDRINAAGPPRVASILAWDAAQAVAEGLLAAAAAYGDSDSVSAADLFKVVAGVGGAPWATVGGLRQSLSALADAGTPYTQTKTVAVYDTAAFLDALVGTWSVSLGDHSLRNHWARTSAMLDAARSLRQSAALPVRSSIKEIESSLQSLCPVAVVDHTRLLAAAKAAGATSVGSEPRTIAASRSAGSYPARVALKSLAEQVLRRVSPTRPDLQVRERTMTTAQMIAEGVKVHPGGKATTNFAIRLAKPVDLPEADLPLDPYVLGTWLGDGTSNGGGFTGIDAEIWQEFEAAGFEVHHGTVAKAHYVQRLVGPLRAAGVLNNKHIPMTYLRASTEQRLAVLQGLMDTDGSIADDGGCELSLCHERLAADALELVRSLGIKATMNAGDATITETDADGAKSRRVTGTRWRITFTTGLPVFRLPRKAEKVKETLRATQDWLYVTDIVPAGKGAGKCLTVDSDDHTFLVGGFVATHNTTTAAMLGNAIAGNATYPVLVIDVNPDGGSLGVRVPITSKRTTLDLRDALRANEQLPPTELGDYVNRSPFRLDAIVMPPGKKPDDPLTGADFQSIVNYLRRYGHYKILVVDCGTDPSGPVMDGVLAEADQLVVVATTIKDEATVTAGGLEVLAREGMEDLVEKSIVAMVEKSPKDPDAAVQAEITRTAEQVRTYFADFSRQVVPLPYDSRIRIGNTLDPAAVSPETRMGHLELAAAVVERLREESTA